ncbi:hypothetical protein AA984_13755 [Brevibacillus formosus]|uniref:Uncharacterized protein n=1 Tax=Brevibacillus formosus TaxID=54913 RepID=A0A837KLN7_9BACL|nr:hypothetical protein AA984_13755 [Brevibacillus formosus]
MRSITAIDQQACPCDEGGIVAGKEQNSLSHFFWFIQASHQMQPDQVLIQSFIAPSNQRCARRNGIIPVFP